MNPQANAHFAAFPASVEMPRSSFDRSYRWVSTSRAGVLNCFMAKEVYPGDSVDGRITHLSRMTTPIYPVMDTLQLEHAVFFVPNRLLWQHWKQFMGENDTSQWTPSSTYTVPFQPLLNTTDSSGNPTRTPGDYAHQMGFAINVTVGSAAPNASALPFRALRLCYNEWFRTPTVDDPLPLNVSDNPNDYSYLKPLPVGRVRDYFSTCTPQPQFGDAVRAMLQGFAPVFAASATTNDLTASDKTKAGIGELRMLRTSNMTAPTSDAGLTAASTSGKVYAAASDTLTSTTLTPANLVVNPEVLGSLGLDVNTLRLAFAAQRVLEKLAMCGNRYIESIRAFFGVISPDARQQRPQLLGYGKQYVNMTDVPQSSATASGQTPLGTVGAYSKTVSKDCTWSSSFTEHGWLIGVYWYRIARTYTQGYPRELSRFRFEDYYNPAYAFIGQQPVYVKELYGLTSSLSDIFGYNEAWSEMRYSQSIACGLMDPAVTGSLGTYWTYADYYQSAPTLSASWMHEGDANVARTLAVVDQDQFLDDVFVESTWTRVLPTHSIPGLIDHF